MQHKVPSIDQLVIIAALQSTFFISYISIKVLFFNSVCVLSIYIFPKLVCLDLKKKK